MAGFYFNTISSDNNRDNTSNNVADKSSIYDFEILLQSLSFCGIIMLKL